MNAKETTQIILEMLKALHSKNSGRDEWAIFPELNIGTGAKGGRWIDLWAVNMYPSKGNIKIAYEIKASRSDFLRELEDPLKRSGAEAWSNECYFVAPAGLISPKELPEGWGLIELTLSGLRKKVAAPYREVRLTEPFIYSVLRRTGRTEKQNPPPVELMNELARLRQLQNVIKEEIGYFYAVDPSRLREYLKTQTRPLKETRRKIAKLLAEVDALQAAFDRAEGETEL
ncbi:MAG: hypothetical protein KA314_09305 [Chloroflexi bacterium]|nr:hypothetical protein [Chloroflexota bacterium]MBP8056027.1 hypothetical protein [Chloroflexota bacterium]